MKIGDIINAYVKIRTIDQTIPDDVLDFMKDAAIQLIEQYEPKPTAFVGEPHFGESPVGSVNKSGMDKLIIYRFQAEHIQDAFRLVARTLESDKKETSMDRDIMQGWEMIKNVVSENIDQHVKRF